jgi:hypothetical protein
MKSTELEVAQRVAIVAASVVAVAGCIAAFLVSPVLGWMAVAGCAAWVARNASIVVLDLREANKKIEKDKSSSKQ